MFTELGRKVYENSENFQKMIENIRKYQTEVTTELKNIPEGFNSRLDEVEEWINELEEKTLDLIQTEQQMKTEF